MEHFHLGGTFHAYPAGYEVGGSEGRKKSQDKSQKFHKVSGIGALGPRFKNGCNVVSLIMRRAYAEF
jgi:hypothetical protein